MRKSLINRKELDERFIDNAISEKADTEIIKEDLHKYVKLSKWPILEEASPSYAKGSHLNKNINLPLKEYEWNSIDRHTKMLGIAKTEWIRYAIAKLLQEEQIYFLKNHNERRD